MAGALNTLLRNVCQLSEKRACGKTFIFFAYLSLCRTDSSHRNRPQLSLDSLIKNQADEDMACTGSPELSPTESYHIHKRTSNKEDALPKQVNIKFMEGEIREVRS